MAVNINRPGLVDVVPTGTATVTRRVYWDETKTRLLEEGHPEARFLAYAEGTSVPSALVVEPATVVAVPVEPVPLPDPMPSTVPDPGVSGKSTRRTRRREDRQVAPGVVQDTSLDGVVHTLAPEPVTPIPNGVNP